MMRLRTIDERSHARWRVQRYALLIWLVIVTIVVTVLELHDGAGRDDARGGRGLGRTGRVVDERLIGSSSEARGD
jgi:hypothetical protein